MSETDKNQSILDDVSASFKSLITERFTSPFLFSFTVAWLVFNHKLLILSLSDTTDKFSIKEKFELFNSVLNSSFMKIPFVDGTLLLNGFLFPLLSAFFYTFMYPFADYYITKFTLERKVKLRNLRVQKEQEIYYTFEDIQKIYFRHADEEKNWKLRIDKAEMSDNQKDNLINELQNRLNELDKKNAELDKSIATEEDSKKSLIDEAKQAIELKKYDEAKNLLETIKKIGTNSEKNQARTLSKNLIKLEAENNISQTDLTKHEQEILYSLGKAINNNLEWVDESELLVTKKGISVLDKKIALNDLMAKKLIDKEYKAEIAGDGVELTLQGMKLYNLLHSNARTKL